jgi:Xaa-Pro aminopeptidase
MESNEYIKRRAILRDRVKTGVILLCGNSPVPRNYPGNPYPFRQDSTFLYYTGIDAPGYHYLLDCDKNEEILFGKEAGIDDQIWSGPQITHRDLSDQTGIKKVMPVSKLNSTVAKFLPGKKTIHYLPPYPHERKLFLSELLGKKVPEICANSSVILIRAVVSQRSVKSGQEVSQIEKVLSNVTGPMHRQAIKKTLPGTYEFEVVAEMSNLMKRSDLEYAYFPICSVRGEILHNESHKNQLSEGDLLLIDAGAESSMHYASDITRTIPVSGKYSDRQSEIYNLVLTTEQHTIEKIRPGVAYADLHQEAALEITDGLIALGLMKGNALEAVREGAHALFFPHGLGHMMGLDVHDMEDLGEDYVGYDGSAERSGQFGTAYLRLAKTLQPGFVLTVEPGIYFIPALIDLWKSQKKFEHFIHYSNVEKYRNFGGIRIEDNVVVENDGGRILGNPIPKLQSDIEQLMGH